jgi:hypothetical protein
MYLYSGTVSSFGCNISILIRAKTLVDSYFFFVKDKFSEGEEDVGEDQPDTNNRIGSLHVPL